jgi:hypothetical protein
MHFSDSRFALKVFWFVVGITFIGWLVSSLHPRYRLLVSPFEWTLWEVPTHAEWCFQYLKERATHAKLFSPTTPTTTLTSARGRTLHMMIQTAIPTTRFTALEPPRKTWRNDILSFGCTHLHPPGRFIIYTHSIRFVSLLNRACASL